MLMDFCYYFISSGLLASALFSSYCYYDKENAKQLIFNVSWRGTHAYFVVKSYIDDLLNKTNEATIVILKRIRTMRKIQTQCRNNVIYFLIQKI